MTTTVAMMWLEIGDWRADWIGGCYHISVAASEIRWAFKFQHAQCHLGCFEAIDFVLLLVLFYIDACACWCPIYVTIDGPAWQVLFIGIYWHNPKRMTNHHLIIIYWLFKHQYQNIKSCNFIYHNQSWRHAPVPRLEGGLSTSTCTCTQLSTPL